MLSLMTWTSTSSPRRKISWIGGLTRPRPRPARPPRASSTARARSSGPRSPISRSSSSISSISLRISCSSSGSISSSTVARGSSGTNSSSSRSALLDALQLLQVEFFEFAEGFRLLAMAAREGTRGRPFLVEFLEIGLEVVGRGRRGLQGPALASRLALAATAAASASATALRPRLARSLILQEGELILLDELGRPRFDVLLEQRFRLALRPIRFGREEVAAEGRIARLHPLPAGDVAGLSRAVVGAGPIPVALAFRLALALPIALPFRFALAFSRGFRGLRRHDASRPRASARLRARGAPGPRGGVSQSPPRDRIAARPPRRRGGSSYRGSSPNAGSSGGRSTGGSGSNSGAGTSSRSAGDGRVRPGPPAPRPRPRPLLGSRVPKDSISGSEMAGSSRSLGSRSGG